MNNISDKIVIIVILTTVLVVLAFIFSVKSPERKVIESPIMWKEDFSTLSFFNNQNPSNFIMINSFNIKIQ